MEVVPNFWRKTEIISPLFPSVSLLQAIFFNGFQLTPASFHLAEDSQEISDGGDHTQEGLQKATPSASLQPPEVQFLGSTFVTACIFFSP